MVWFQCDCGETLKKPKVQSHLQRCSAPQLTCIDCSQSFSRTTVQGHSQCVSEHDKYASGATKQPGYAGGAPAAAATQQQKAQPPVGLEHLSTKWPFECRLCKVTATSKETLQSHAAGAKHVRRVKAAAAAAAGSTATAAAPAQEAQPPATPAAAQEAQPSTFPAQEAAASGAAADAPKASRPPKWKQAARRCLRANAGQMKLKALTRELLAQHPTASKELEASVLQTLYGSSRFQIQGKTITHVAR